MKRTLKAEYISKRSKLFDRSVQRRKRQYWVETQNKLLESCVDNKSNDFWKSMGKVGIGSERTQNIPIEVQQNGKLSNCVDDVLNHWKQAFENLLNYEHHHTVEHNVRIENDAIYNEQLNTGIAIQDVVKAIESLNKNKSAGHDDIPAEVLQSKPCINFLHRLFCVCFETGKIPDSWNCGIITPILKNNTGDKRDPTNYRGITVTTSIYKAYCALLNERLTKGPRKTISLQKSKWIPASQKYDRPFIDTV